MRLKVKLEPVTLKTEPFIKAESELVRDEQEVAEDPGLSVRSHPVLDELQSVNNYNPRDFDMNPKNARFFVLKSYSEDDVHRSIKYAIWCSTEHGNKRLDSAFRERDSRGPVFLFFSVNGSGHFCGMAEMMSCLDYSSSAGVWAQDKWKGKRRTCSLFKKSNYCIIQESFKFDGSMSRMFLIPN